MIHSGSCHCGNIKFTIESEISKLTTCDCSLCVKKNALMTKVHDSAFNLISGEESLSEYQWNMKIARHYFCKKCGIYTFHRKRSDPQYFGVNIFCLDNFDKSGVPTRATEGENMTVNTKDPIETWPGPRVTQ